MAGARYFLSDLRHAGEDEVCIFSRACGGKGSDEDPPIIRETTDKTFGVRSECGPAIH
jgi:hypothetical protein